VRLVLNVAAVLVLFLGVFAPVATYGPAGSSRCVSLVAAGLVVASVELQIARVARRAASVVGGVLNIRP
jgi:hypothetical protein